MNKGYWLIGQDSIGVICFMFYIKFGIMDKNTLLRIDRIHVLTDYTYTDIYSIEIFYQWRN
jgi:hypothetical protein